MRCLFLWLVAAVLVPCIADAERYWIGPVPWFAASGNEPAHFGPPAGVLGWIDMRTTAECGTPGAANGVAIFVTADATNLGGSYTNLGTDPERTLSAGQKSALVAALRLETAPATSVLSDIMLAALTSHADATGTARAKPLVPTDKLRYEVWLAGRKLRDKAFDKDAAEAGPLRQMLQAEYRALRTAVQEGRLPANLHKKWLGFKVRQYRDVPYRWFQPTDLPAEEPQQPETTVTDNFNRADADPLGTASGGGSWTEVSGDFDIVSNVARNPSSTTSRARLESDLSSSDHYAQAKLNIVDDYSGVCARYDSAADTTYIVIAYSVGILIGKSVTGSFTTLASTGASVSAGDVLKLSVSGTSLEAFQNGTSRLAITDGSISSGLRCGIVAHGATNRQIDDFEASDLGGGSTPPAQIILSGGSRPRWNAAAELFLGKVQQ